MKRQRMAILLTSGVGLSILASVGMAGTYVYRDKDGNEVRELPKAETTRGEDGSRSASSRPRKSAEKRAMVSIEAQSESSSGGQR